MTVMVFVAIEPVQWRAHTRSPARPTYLAGARALAAGGCAHRGEGAVVDLTIAIVIFAVAQSDCFAAAGMTGFAVVVAVGAVAYPADSAGALHASRRRGAKAVVILVGVQQTLWR